MVRIQLASLDEFVSSLSRLDYDAAKVANGKFMDHLQMGVAMFSLQTTEEMYTSMDYLTPSNFRRGNDYLVDMYSPLLLHLDKLPGKLAAYYEGERQRLISLRMQPAPSGAAGHSIYGDAPHRPGLAINPQRKRPDRAERFPSAFSVHGRHPSGDDMAHPSPLLQANTDLAALFDPNQYLANMEEAEQMLEELETLKQFVAFIAKFVEVRQTMIVLYRFAAVTGPVLHSHRLTVMLRQCMAVLETIKSQPLYASLLDHVRQEVRLASTLVDWNSHIAVYDFVQSATHMHRAKTLLKKWLGVVRQGGVQGAAAPRPSTGGSSIYESISDALSGRREADGAGSAGQSAGHGLLFTALAKSTRMVQNLLGRGSGSGPGSGAQDPGTSGARGIVVWLSAWVDHLTFKTTAYFQQTIVPQRLLHHGSIPAHAGQAVAMADIWSRPGLAKTNLSELITAFLSANDGLYVALLFESSARHPLSVDGFAVAGTRPHVSDYRVQACKVLSCYTNQKLLLSCGISVSESLVHDVHSTRRGPADRDATESQQPTDVEWFRQNCLPDILCALDGNRSVLDFELLGSNPLLNALGADAEHPLGELRDTLHTTIEEAEAKLSLSKGTDRGADKSIETPMATASHAATAGPWFGQAPNAFKLSAQPPNGPALQQSQHQAQHGAADVSAPDAGSSAMAVPARSSEPDAAADNTLSSVPPARGHGQEGDSSLYSTYLQKSHLRNDAQHGPPARGGDGTRSSARHRSTPRAERGDRARAGTLSGAGPAGAASGQQHLGRRGRPPSGADTPMAAQSSTTGLSGATQVSLPHGQPLARPSLRRITTGATANLDAVSRAGIRAPAGRSEAAGDDRAGATGLPYPHGQPRTTAAAEHGLLRRNSRHSVADTVGSARKRQSLVSASLWSFFGSSSQPATHPNAPSAATGSPEDEITRRVHCGERLTELFGSWRDSDEDVPESVIAPPGGGDNRPGSICSLSFSTPARATASIGTSTLVGGMLGADAHASRFALRPPRSSAQPNPLLEQRRGSRPFVGLRAGEFASAAAEHPHLRNHTPQTASHRQRSEALQLLAAPPVGNRPVTPTAPGGTEGYTYLCSRVDLPNVSLVAVLLDTDKGLDRRRKAEHAWSGIVNAMRGTPLFEQLMALPC